MRTVYDIHMHLIPEVDDGAWNMEMALSMLQMAYAQGIRKIFATPHSSAFFMDEDLVRENYGKLKKEAGQICPDVEIFPGCEVLLEEYSIEKVLHGLEEGRIPSMNGTRYVLAEFHQGAEAEEAEKCTEKLRECGWRPIIAHAERYRFAYHDRAALVRMLAAGCLCQINACSLTEELAGWIRENARWMIQEKLAGFLGSDAHRTFYRPPEVQSGLEYLYSVSERTYADDVAYRNAERLIRCTDINYKY